MTVSPPSSVILPFTRALSTEYFYRSYVISNGEVIYGGAKSFTTLDGKAKVVTGEVRDITVESARVNGSITDDGGDTVIQRGFCWSNVDSFDLSSSIGSTNNGEGLGEFEDTITGLLPDSVYYFTSYGITTVDTTYGEFKSLKTEDGLPTLTTAEVTNVTTQSATSGGTVTDEGGAPITAKGVCWSTSTNPTISDNSTSDGAGIGTFVSSISGLSPVTFYYIRAYASNSFGTSYGSEFMFETESPWIQKADFGGTGRVGAVGFSIGDKGYIGTGIDDQSDPKRDFWEYDPVANSWSQKAFYGGSARSFAVGFVIGDKGYIGTGYDDSETRAKDFWEYDPATNTWSQKADFVEGRWAAVGFSLGDKGYMGTGYDNSNNYKKDFWEYDPVANSWSQKANFGGSARAKAVGFSIGDKGYVGVGNDDGSSVRSSSHASLRKDFWQYDPVTNGWSQLADFGGTARTETVGFSIADKGYIGTGVDGQSDPKRDFWEYDPVANSWSQKADFGGSGRFLPVGFSIGDKGYIGTGASPGRKKDFWEYDPATDQ